MERKSDGAVRAREGAQSIGVVDALGIGFEKVNGMLWVLLFPVLVGLFLWQGPKLSAAPAVAKLLSFYVSSLPPEAMADGSTALPPDAQSLDQMHEMLQTIAGEINLFSFLTIGLGIAGRGAVPALPFSDGGDVLVATPIGEPLSALAAIVVLYLLGLLLGACYLTSLWQGLRGERPSLTRLLLRAWPAWLSMLAFVLALFVATLGIAVPTALLLGTMAMLAPAAVETIFLFVLMLWQTGALWLTLFTFFFVDAVVVSGLGALAAFRNAIRIMARNFWSAGAFVLLYLVISYGTVMIWARLGEQDWGIVLAIFGNAYIATGLAAGSMVFYRARAAAANRT